jgi:hypothetical protein
MVSAEDAEVNCCQRANNLAASQPMLKLTGISLTRPLAFASPAVAGVNKTALENDWYNSVIILDGREDGERKTVVGNVLPNKDGSFTPVRGEFRTSKKFNADGVWDVQDDIPARLATKADGRELTVGPTSADRDLTLVLWFDEAIDFPRLELHVRGVEYTLPLTPDLSCAGQRNANKTFDQIGEIRGYLPLAAARTTELYVTKSESGTTNLCEFAAQSSNCDEDLTRWRKP